MILCANKPRLLKYIIIFNQENQLWNLLCIRRKCIRDNKTCLQNIPILIIHFHEYAYVKLVIDLFFNGCIVSHFLIIYRGFTFSAILVFSSPSCVVILKRNFLICMLILARSCYGCMTQSIKRVWLKANLFEVNSTRKLG